MTRVPTPRRGDVWLVALEPTFGHEIRKTRPAIVVTNDIRAALAYATELTERRVGAR